MFKLQHVELSPLFTYKNVFGWREKSHEIIFISSGKVQKYPLTNTCEKNSKIIIINFHVLKGNMRRKKAFNDCFFFFSKSFSIFIRNEELEREMKRNWEAEIRTKGRKWIIGPWRDPSRLHLVLMMIIAIWSVMLFFGRTRRKKNINIYSVFSWPIFYF